jgi:hypothetical protein
MASATAKTQHVRRRKAATRGKEGKRIRRNRGSTPAFPIHKDKAAETK